MMRVYSPSHNNPLTHTLMFYRNQCSSFSHTHTHTHTHTHAHTHPSLSAALTHTLLRASLSLSCCSLSLHRERHTKEGRHSTHPLPPSPPPLSSSSSLSLFLPSLLFSFSSHRLWAQSLGTQGSSRAYTCLSSWTRVVPDGSDRDFGYSQHGRRQAELLFALNPKPLPSTC